MPAVYQVTSRSGVTKGSSWQISTKALTLGRGLNCDICIADPSVSRRHCEIVMDDSQIRLRDLGSSNNTLVNGTMVQECVLHVGDEIGIGGELFIITSTTAASDHGAPEESEAATLSLSETDIGYLGNGAAAAVDGRPKTVSDLLALFGFSRDFSRATSMQELIDALRAAVSHHFATTSIWIARYHGATNGFVLYAQPAKDIRQPAPFNLMRETLLTGKGILKAGRGPGNSRIMHMAAPIQVGGEQIGAMVVESAGERRLLDETDLGFLIALANTVAPFVNSTEKIEQLRLDNERLRHRAGQATKLVGTSRAIEMVRAQIQDAAHSMLSVLVLGETGTGKELVSRMIHDHSPRSSAPFVTLNCAAIPRELFESELFGYEKGAFTGAIQGKAGRLQQAHGGTIFFDEMGDLSLENQARLLRAIESGTFHRIGATEETSVDFRVVCATNRDLRAAVARGEFRADLYHRINGFEVRVPPLRERPEDIRLLAEYFFELGSGQAKRPLAGISKAAMDALQSRAWPGNVRQLRACIYRAIAIAKTDYIEVEDVRDANETSSDDGRAPLLSLRDIEKEHIARILRDCSGNVSAAARILDISRNTLYNKISEYQIEL